MAGVLARPCGTNALPALSPVRRAEKVMSGSRAFGPVSRNEGHAAVC